MKKYEKKIKNPGFISEFEFCELYGVPIDQFTRWVMTQPKYRITAGFSTTLYNIDDLILHLDKIRSTR